MATHQLHLAIPLLPLVIHLQVLVILLLHLAILLLHLAILLLHLAILQAQVVIHKHILVAILVQRLPMVVIQLVRLLNDLFK